MPSPFPGMDPWLERPAVFGGVHVILIPQLLEAINTRLPPGYVASANYLVWIAPELRRVPDVGMSGPDERPDGSVATESFAEQGMLCLAADPVAEPWEQPYLEILADDGERLVTAVELLSLSNKKSGASGRAAYLQKQDEFRLGGVNIVEIDLLRGGLHSTAVPLDRLRASAPDYDYRVCVTVIGEPTLYHVKPFRMSDRLPTVVVPLDPGVPTVKVDLQPILDRTYDIGRFAERAKYKTKSPDPPLTPEQQAWADAILRARA